jgi:antitoxin ParD1/3/4
MQTPLPKALEPFVRELIESGMYGCEGEVIEHALWLLKDKVDLYKHKREELKKLIAVGIEQADRGELIEGELVFAKLREKIQKSTGQAP